MRFTAAGILEPRRGFRYIDNGLGTASSRADSFAYYAATILAAYDLTKVSLFTSSWNSFAGAYLPVGANRMRFEGAARTEFFNTSQGLVAWDGAGNAGQPVGAGAPQGLDMDVQPDTANGWQTADSAVAYRHTICSKDAFSRIIEGAPSGRATLRNKITVAVGGLVRSGTEVDVTYNAGQNTYVLQVGDLITLSPGETDFPAGVKTITSVNNTYSTFTYTEAGSAVASTIAQTFSIATSGLVTVWLPPDATVQNFVRAYRSFETLGGAGDTPSDELFQVYESAYLSAADLAAGFIQFVDTAPQDTLNVPLYTNTNTGDGALQANFQPPVSLDIVYWAQRMWFANTANRHQLEFAVIGCGSPDGLVAGSDLEIYHSGPVNVTFIGVNYDPLLPAPVPVTFTTSGTGGSLGAGTYYYRVVATAAVGAVYSLPSVEASVVVASGSTNKNTVKWNTVAGATGYSIYGRTSGGELLIASVGVTNSYIDTGSITPSGPLPTRPSMGDYFYVRTDSDPGANIQTTAKSLVRSINLSVNNTATVALNAYYVSSEGGIPGSIALVARSFGDGSSFSLYSSNTPQAWAPQLPSTPVDNPFVAPKSSANLHPAGLFYSKYGQPEAVPAGNFEAINSDNDSILRIFPLHYRLLIFKTDGIYTCSNLLPFTVTKLSAYVLLAPDSVCVLEDRVYCLTDQGVVTISDSGLVQVSNPIDDIFNAMMSPGDIATLAARAFAVAYRSERQVILWVPQFNDDGTVTADNEQAFVFSTLASGWTRYAFGARCAAINPATNSLTFAPPDNNEMCGENKSLTDLDYYDLALTVGSPVSVSGADLTFTSTIAALMTVGDVLKSTANDYYPITAISDTTVTVSGSTGWTGASTLTLYIAIEPAIEFNKITAGTPADLKMVGQVSFLFRENGVHDTNTSFASEISPLAEDVLKAAHGWGEFSWGGVPYGSVAPQLMRVEPLPASAAQCAQLSVGFSTRQALAKFAFLGLDAVEAEDTTANRGA